MSREYIENLRANYKPVAPSKKTRSKYDADGKPRKSNRRRLARVKAAVKRQSKRRAEYAAYMRSPEWKTFRLTIIAKRGKVCEECGSAKPPHHLHHKTYARFKKEREDDVELLCESCHEKRHNRSLRVKRVTIKAV